MKCVICGTVRNCGPYLMKVVSNMKKIGSLFEEFNVILCVDKSKDKTLSLIQRIQEENPSFVIHINKDAMYSERTANLCKARNKYLEIIRERFINYDYFIVMDCDNVCSQMTDVNILKYHLENSEKWDGLTFNKNPYYDIWALSIYPYFINCHWFYNYQKYTMYVKNLLRNCHKNNYVSCLSSFNGFAIYKLPLFIEGKYLDKTEENLNMIPKNLIKVNLALMNFRVKNYLKVDCEHKFFHYHAVLKKNARLMISPQILFR